MQELADLAAQVAGLPVWGRVIKPASGFHDLASVSRNVRSVSANVRRLCATVSESVRRERPESRVEPFIIARRYT